MFKTKHSFHKPEYNNKNGMSYTFSFIILKKIALVLLIN